MKNIAGQKIEFSRYRFDDRLKPQMWRQVILGMYDDTSTLLTALRERECTIDEAAEEVMLSPIYTLTSEKSVLSLVRVTARELDVPNYHGYQSFYSRCLAVGLIPCPLELPAQLCRQYETQPEGELLRIITRHHIPNARGRPRSFILARYGGTQHLTLCISGPNTHFGSDDVFVWALPHRH